MATAFSPSNQINTKRVCCFSRLFLLQFAAKWVYWIYPKNKNRKPNSKSRHRYFL